MSAAAERHLAGALLGLATFALYAGYDITIKFFGGVLNPLQVLFCAGSFVIPMFAGQMVLSGQTRNLWPVLPGWMALRIVVFILNGALGAYAFSVLPLAECYAIFFLMPLLVAALAALILGERMDLPRALAIMAGLVGVVVALQPGVTTLQIGHLSALAGAILGALNYLIIRRTSGAESPGVILLYPTLAQVAVLGLAMPLVWQPMTTGQVGLTFLMALELFIGGYAIVTAYRLAAAIVVAPMQYSQIAWAALFGWLLFGERIRPATALGIAVIIAAGLFLLWRSARR